MAALTKGKAHKVEKVTGKKRLQSTEVFDEGECSGGGGGGCGCGVSKVNRWKGKLRRVKLFLRHRYNFPCVKNTEE